METLYRKYRPQLFAAVRGQEHVVQTLRGALLSGEPGHAYLFAGPRGTGKTTLARLFAKALNCENLNKKTAEPCNTCQECTSLSEGRSFDLIEIDAASNRGIDEIRALKDSAAVSTHSSNYKIFLIDEVHMLTTPAFNALLKVLEEPPKHVIFIMATTEPHKILETVLSRVQRFDFKKITRDDIIEKLKKISTQEKIGADDAVYPMIAMAASGSLRDAESILTKLANHTRDRLTVAITQNILGIVPDIVHEQLWQVIINKDRAGALAITSDLAKDGVNFDQFCQHFLGYMRSILLESQDKITQALAIKTIRAIGQARNEIRFSPISHLPLELAFIELTENHA